MSAEDGTAARSRALSEALASGALPEAASAAARRLLERLGMPVRVALMGPPKSGKSRILHLLSGADIAPEGIRLPTLRLVHGKRPQARLTLANGRSQLLKGIDPAAIAARSPVLVEISTDLPSLTKISLLEVVAGADRGDQARASIWASRHADVAIWCTRRFDADERAVWGALPDVLRDHGILLRTHADLLGDPAMRAPVQAALDRAAGDAFPHVLMLDTPAALAARGADGQVDRPRFRASGGQALIATILREVAMGRQTALDQADILLRRHGQGSGAAADRTVVPGAAAPAPRQGRAQDVTMPLVPLPDPAAGTGTQATLSRVAAKVAAAKAAAKAAAEAPPRAAPETPAAEAARPDSAAPASGMPDSQAIPVAAGMPSAAVRAAFETAIARLSETGAELASDAAGAEDVMRRSVDELHWLSTHLEELDATGPTLEAARDIAMEATDIVQLLQIEKRDGAALEAVSLMIQLRRNLAQSLHMPAALAA